MLRRPRRPAGLSEILTDISSAQELPVEQANEAQVRHGITKLHTQCLPAAPVIRSFKLPALVRQLDRFRV